MVICMRALVVLTCTALGISMPAAAVVTFCTDLQEPARAAAIEVARELDRGQIPTSEQASSALLAAALSGDLRLLEQLIPRVENLDAPVPQDEFSMTPLVAASWCGHPQLVSSLLHAGADPNACGSLPFAGEEGAILVCPLHAALAGAEFEGGDPSIVKSLVDAGANRHPDGRGARPDAYLRFAPPPLRAQLIDILDNAPR